MNLHDRNNYIFATGEPEIGNDTWIGPFTVLDAAYGLEIGDRCSISTGAQLYSHSMTKPGREAGEMERSETKIGDDVHIGANAVVMHGCTISDGATIGANAVVPKETTVPSNETWAGIPAERID
jgi:acetyltransferase-like isoleucine patch superfamily enzyme